MRGGGDHAEKKIDSLRRSQVRHVDDQKFIVADPKLSAHFVAAFRWPVWREEIWDNVDRIA